MKTANLTQYPHSPDQRPPPYPYKTVPAYPNKANHPTHPNIPRQCTAHIRQSHHDRSSALS
jgi:hypothetical protein